MTNNRSGKYSRALLVVGLSVLGLSASLHADDTEIYQTTYDASLSGRPKVLIAIDDSGSMDTVVPDSKPAYDPAATYTGTANTSRIYWSTTGSPSVRFGTKWLSMTSTCAQSALLTDSSSASRLAKSADRMLGEICTTQP